MAIKPAQVSATMANRVLCHSFIANYDQPQWHMHMEKWAERTMLNHGETHKN